MNTQVTDAAYQLANSAEPVMLRRTIKERLRRPLMFAFPIILAAAGATKYIIDLPYVSTTDAFVRAAKVSINARVSGQVVELAVHDNQHVRKGQFLFGLDPEPYKIGVQRAEADLADARLQIDALKAKYRQQFAELQSSKDTAAFDEHEVNRIKPLLAADFASKSAFDKAETALKVAQHNVTSSEEQLASTVAALNGDPNVDTDTHPKVREALAQLSQARLDLSYTRVMAPDDGIVTQVDNLQVGNFVNSGATVFSLLSSDDKWIEANFRETDLTQMHPGQLATVAVDAYPGRSFKARIVSMSPGTGSDFSLLPPENATGNWVKVVQRLPVRLKIDNIGDQLSLFSGVSATVRVDTTGHPVSSDELQIAAGTESDK